MQLGYPRVGPYVPEWCCVEDEEQPERLGFHTHKKAKSQRKPENNKKISLKKRSGSNFTRNACLTIPPQAPQESPSNFQPSHETNNPASWRPQYSHTPLAGRPEEQKPTLAQQRSQFRYNSKQYTPEVIAVPTPPVINNVQMPFFSSISSNQLPARHTPPQPHFQPQPQQTRIFYHQKHEQLSACQPTGDVHNKTFSIQNQTSTTDKHYLSSTSAQTPKESCVIPPPSHWPDIHNLSSNLQPPRISLTRNGHRGAQNRTYMELETPERNPIELQRLPFDLSAPQQWKNTKMEQEKNKPPGADSKRSLKNPKNQEAKVNHFYHPLQMRAVVSRSTLSQRNYSNTQMQCVPRDERNHLMIAEGANNESYSLYGEETPHSQHPNISTLSSRQKTIQSVCSSSIMTNRSEVEAYNGNDDEEFMSLSPMLKKFRTRGRIQSYQECIHPTSAMNPQNDEGGEGYGRGGQEREFRDDLSMGNKRSVTGQEREFRDDLSMGNKRSVTGQAVRNKIPALPMTEGVSGWGGIFHS